MANGSLTTIYSWSLALNNMINLSLIKDNEAKYNKFFVFLNIVPSAKTADGQRTYNFKEGINFKLQSYKLYEISQVIPAYLKGGQKFLGNYGIINDSSKASHGMSSGLKSLYINYSEPEEKNKNIPGIFLVAKSGDNKTIGVGIPAPTALAFAEMCKKIFDLSIEYDIKAYEPYNGGRASDDRGNYHSSEQSSKSDQQMSGSENNFNSFNDEAPF